MHNLRINLAVHRLPSDSMVLAVENIFSPCFLASFLSFCLHLHSAIPRCLYIMSKRIQYSKIYRTVPYSWCLPWLFKFHSLFVVVVRISPSLFYLTKFCILLFQLSLWRLSSSSRCASWGCCWPSRWCWCTCSVLTTTIGSRSSGGQGWTSSSQVSPKMFH